MFTVKNKLNQPLVVNVPEEVAIHFLAKEQRDLTTEQFNAPEIKNYIELEYLIVLRMD